MIDGALGPKLTELTQPLMDIVKSWENKNVNEEDCIVNGYDITTRKIADDFLNKLNKLFETKVSFQYKSNILPIYFSANTEDQIINFPRSYLNKVCRGDATVNEMFFIISHEYSHNLIEPKINNIDMLVEDWAKKIKNNKTKPLIHISMNYHILTQILLQQKS